MPGPCKNCQWIGDYTRFGVYQNAPFIPFTSPRVFLGPSLCAYAVVITKTRSIFIQEELYSLSSCHESMSDRQSHNHHQHQRLCRDYPAREDSRICPSIGWVALDPWRISLVARTCPSRLITYQGWTKSVQINNLSLFLRGHIKHRRKMFHSFWAMDWYEKCFFLSYKAILNAQWPRKDDNGSGMCNGKGIRRIIAISFRPVVIFLSPSQIIKGAKS